MGRIGNRNHRQYWNGIDHFEQEHELLETLHKQLIINPFTNNTYCDVFYGKQWKI